MPGCGGSIGGANAGEDSVSVSGVGGGGVGDGGVGVNGLRTGAAAATLRRTEATAVETSWEIAAECPMAPVSVITSPQRWRCCGL